MPDDPPVDPCVKLTADQEILEAAAEAAQILLDAAQQLVIDTSTALMINTMNLYSNGCIPGGMMAIGDAGPVDQRAIAAVKTAMEQVKSRAALSPDTFNRKSVAQEGLAKLLEAVKSADKNVVAK